MLYSGIHPCLSFFIQKMGILILMRTRCNSFNVLTLVEN